MTATLYVRTTDGWTTKHPDAENVHIEGDELIYERGRDEVRLDLNEILEWRTLSVHSGLER